SQVARLAGVPAAVVNHARHTLEALEAQATESNAQVDLFAAPPAAESTAASAIETAVAALDPDTLSPREALDALYQLKKISATS
ncbi:MAG: DNA mismatch repair protein MutS, partial [Rhodoferax sp.]